MITLSASPSTTATSAPASSSSSSSNSPESWEENRPSQALFYLAIIVGVLIAIIFIFFALRYFVRARVVRTFSDSPSSELRGISTDLFHHHRHFLPTFANPFALFDSHIPVDQLHLVSAVSSAKFSKKFRLTQEELDYLFPERTYADWLNGGAEKDAFQRDIHAKIKYSDDPSTISLDDTSEMLETHAAAANVGKANDTTSQLACSVSNLEKLFNPTTTATSINQADIGLTELSTIRSNSDAKSIVSIHQPPPEIADEPHFSSGSCAICIDEFEADDIVRGLICGHVFHKDCVDPWLSNRKACCPLCKRDYFLKNRIVDGVIGSDSNENSGDHRFDLMSPEEINRLRETERILQASQRNVVEFNLFNMRSLPFTGPISVPFRITTEINPSNTAPTTANPNQASATTNTDRNTRANDDNSQTRNNESDADPTVNEVVNLQQYNDFFEHIRPLSFRAAEALQSHPELEEIAKAKVESELYGWRYRIFWRFMGIKKQDLVNSVIVSKFREMNEDQNENGAETENSNGNNNDSGNSSQNPTQGSNDFERDLGGSTDQSLRIEINHDMATARSEVASLSSRGDIVDQRRNAVERLA